jgi:hypothetical protein
MRCLEKRPEQRFQRILNLQNALEEALAKGVSQISDTATQGKTSPPTENIKTNYSPVGERSAKVKAFWLGVSILIPISILLAFILRLGQDTNRLAINNNSQPINAPTIWQAPTPTWDTYSSTSLGFRINYPPSWVYQEQGTNPVIVIASSQKVLNSEGYASDGAAVAIAYTFLEQSKLPSSVDITSPESILDHFMAENFSHPSLQGTIESMSVSGYPAASAVYKTDNSNQDLKIILYGVAVVTPKAVTLMLGICPDDEWLIFQPVFDRMRDSLKLD